MAEVKHFYVTLRRGERTAWLAGPFTTHAEAIALVDRAHDEACNVDPRAWWDACGTASVKLPAGRKAPAGRLNAALGLPL